MMLYVHVELFPAWSVTVTVIVFTPAFKVRPLRVVRVGRFGLVVAPVTS